MGRAVLREKYKKGRDPYKECVQDVAPASGSVTAPHAGSAVLEFTPFACSHQEMLAGCKPSTRLTLYRGSNALMPQAALKNIPRIICYDESPGFVSQQHHHSSQRKCNPTDQPNSSQCSPEDLKGSENSVS